MFFSDIMPRSPTQMRLALPYRFSMVSTISFRVVTSVRLSPVLPKSSWRGTFNSGAVHGPSVEEFGHVLSKTSGDL